MQQRNGQQKPVNAWIGRWAKVVTLSMMMILPACKSDGMQGMEQRLKEVLPTIKAPELQQKIVKTDLPDYGTENRITLNMQGNIALLKFMLFDQGIMVSFPSDILEQQVRVVARDIEPSIILQTVLSQFENEYLVLRRGPETYLVGKPDSSDLVVRVFSMPDPELYTQTQAAIQGIGTKAVTLTAVGDRLIVRDTVDGMKRIEKMYGALVQAEGQYIVEVQFIEINRALTRKLGVDWNLSGGMNLDVNTINQAVDGTAALSAVLQATILADENQRFAKLLTSATLHCIEGKEAELQTGTTTPVALKSVSSEGTVTTTGFNEIDTGLLLKVSINREPEGRLRVTVEPELSQVVGTVEGAPVRSRRRLKTMAVIDPGGVIIVGGTMVQNQTTAKDGLPYLSQFGMESKDEEDTRVFVVLRVLDPALVGS